jgi:hypothetical protein
VGVVLNMITRAAGKYDYQYGYYYTTYRPESSKGGKRGDKGEDSGATKFASTSSDSATRGADLDLDRQPSSNGTSTDDPFTLVQPSERDER